jgi:fructokinase
MSAVGSDFLGDEIRRRLLAWKIGTECVAVQPHKLTGAVRVDVSDVSNPVYDIIDDVAWDYIPIPDNIDDVTKDTRAVVFGSLATRHPFNRSTLATVLSNAVGLKVFDVNLRAPFYDLESIVTFARKAELVKVNESELYHLCPDRTDNMTQAAQRLSFLAHGADVCVTCGKAGAGLLYGKEWYWCDAHPIPKVGDAVGAGDAFLAGLLHHLLRGSSPTIALSSACRLAEFVASSDGPTPLYDAGLFVCDC